MTTANIGQDAYNDFTQLPQLSYNCIKYLMNNNELVWKLLKYNEPDAWQRDNLTQEEKASLIYSGQQDSSKFNVFMDDKQPDVMTEEVALLRIFPTYAVGLDRTIGLIEMAMEVFSHYKINHLTNYQTRVDTIVGEMMALFNGANVGSLGYMNFNRMADISVKLYEIGQIPFGGKKVIFASFAA